MHIAEKRETEEEEDEGLEEAAEMELRCAERLAEEGDWSSGSRFVTDGDQDGRGGSGGGARGLSFKSTSYILNPPSSSPDWLSSRPSAYGS